MKTVKFKVIIKNAQKQIISSSQGETTQSHSQLFGDREITRVVNKMIKQLDGLRIGDTVTIKRPRG